MSKLTYCFSNSQPDRGRWRVKIFDLMMVVTKCVVHGKVVSHVQDIWVYIEDAYEIYWAGNLENIFTWSQRPILDPHKLINL